MTRFNQICWAAIFTLAAATIPLPKSVIAQAIEESNKLGVALKVMSFNIRYGTANDGENSWEFRRELVAETIGLFSPDLFGVQEALQFQCEYLSESHAGYEFFGRSREVDPETGEFCGIFFRSDRFELIDSGHFWLSENPDKPGSCSWDSSLPRMVSWVQLKDFETDGAQFVFANTHFDHRGPVARLRAAQLIRQRLIDDQPLPVILTGDFNCDAGSEPWIALHEANGADSRVVHDTFRSIHPATSGDDGTFSTWTGETSGLRIDWILHTDEFTTLDAWTNHLRQLGRFPSDHYPVQAIIKLKLGGFK